MHQKGKQFVQTVTELVFVRNAEVVHIHVRDAMVPCMKPVEPATAQEYRPARAVTEAELMQQRVRHADIVAVPEL